jgi:hypothetical protein
MKRLTLSGMALCVALALCAAAAAVSDAAVPEYKLAAGQTFPVNFTGTGGKAILEDVGGAPKIECSKSKTSGTVTNSKEGTATATFEGCLWNLGGACQNNGIPKSGLVSVTDPTDLVLLSEAPLTAGILLLPANKKTNRLVVLECETALGIVKVEVRANNVNATDGEDFSVASPRSW